MPQDKWEDIPDSNQNEWVDIPNPKPATPAKEFPQLTPMQASMQGLGGFIEGALGDLPSTIGSSLKSTGLLALNPLEWGKRTIPEIPGALSSAWETTKSAGSDPEAFGRMMGNVTGQPLATEGLATGLPIRALGYPIAGVGRIMQNYAPFSGFIPAKALGMRNLWTAYKASRAMERATGRNVVEPFGEWLKQPNKLGVARKLEVPFSSSGTEFTPIRQGEVVPSAITSKELPTKVPQKLLGAGSTPPQQPLAHEMNVRMNPQTGEKFTGDSIIKPDFTNPAPTKPKLRANTDGSFTNLETGEVIPPPKPVGPLKAEIPTQSNVNQEQWNKIQELQQNYRDEWNRTGIKPPDEPTISKIQDIIKGTQQELTPPQTIRPIKTPELVNDIPPSLKTVKERKASKLATPETASPQNKKIVEDTLRMQNERYIREQDPAFQAAQKAKNDAWELTQANLEATTRMEKDFGVGSFNNPTPEIKARWNNMSDEEFNKIHAQYLAKVQAERQSKSITPPTNIFPRFK
jgi:hypothetical protein